MVPVTMTSTYFVLGQSLVMIPCHKSFTHSDSIKLARFGSGFKIRETDSRTDGSVIWGLRVPVRMSWTNSGQCFSKNLMARMKPEAKTAPTRRTSLCWQRPQSIWEYMDW
uniref:Uncharacterized protein n=1 Tax=Opuntia streptacantha TaxID=393608 RepID=A0A7C9ALL8_OPUST